MDKSSKKASGGARASIHADVYVSYSKLSNVEKIDILVIIAIEALQSLSPDILIIPTEHDIVTFVKELERSNKGRKSIINYMIAQSTKKSALIEQL